MVWNCTNTVVSIMCFCFLFARFLPNVPSLLCFLFMTSLFSNKQKGSSYFSTYLMLTFYLHQTFFQKTMTSQRESKFVYEQTPLGKNEQKRKQKHIMETTNTSEPTKMGFLSINFRWLQIDRKLVFRYCKNAKINVFGYCKNAKLMFLGTVKMQN